MLRPQPTDKKQFALDKEGKLKAFHSNYKLCHGLFVTTNKEDLWRTCRQFNIWLDKFEQKK